MQSKHQFKSALTDTVDLTYGTVLFSLNSWVTSDPHVSQNDILFIQFIQQSTQAGMKFHVINVHDPTSLFFSVSKHAK